MFSVKHSYLLYKMFEIPLVLSIISYNQYGESLKFLYFAKNIKVNLATVVEGDPKVPFSIATTPRCRGERHSFPWIAPLYPWSIPYKAVY